MAQTAKEYVDHVLAAPDTDEMEHRLAAVPVRFAAEVGYRVARHFADAEGRQRGVRAAACAPRPLRSLVLRLMAQG